MANPEMYGGTAVTGHGEVCPDPDNFVFYLVRDPQTGAYCYSASLPEGVGSITSKGVESAGSSANQSTETST